MVSNWDHLINPGVPKILSTGQHVQNEIHYLILQIYHHLAFPN